MCVRVCVCVCARVCVCVCVCACARARVCARASPLTKCMKLHSYFFFLREHIGERTHVYVCPSVCMHACM